ncbi:MAG: hypothetical protein O2923_14870 [Verrucomicrobia bacterium]|nr:hypothetical protein [Verrucomicrobiota bacterium]MDA1088637.1 hypothetical protein [Verrucomicrobiota bacterium]
MKSNIILSCVAAVALSLVLYSYRTGTKIGFDTPLDAARNLVRISEFKLPAFDMSSELDPADPRVYVGRNNVWAVLMMTSEGDEATTLVAMADGSITFTREIDGKPAQKLLGNQHETALRMNTIADSLYGLCGSAQPKNKPIPGETIFCIMSRSGLAIYRANTDALASIDSEFAPLYHAGRGILTDLAKANPSPNGQDFEQMTASVR